MNVSILYIIPMPSGVENKANPPSASGTESHPVMNTERPDRGKILKPDMARIVTMMYGTERIAMPGVNVGANGANVNLVLMPRTMTTSRRNMRSRLFACFVIITYESMPEDKIR